MKAAFTICSNNYLAHALTLAASVRKHAADWRFFILLVDSPKTIPGVRVPVEVSVIPIDQIGIASLDEMALRYNIIELCTAVKPFCFQYLLQTFPELQEVHYLDPDTVLFNSPRPLSEALETSAILLTPHHLTPIPLDGLFPDETLALNHGVYNLGYLGVRRSTETDALMRWWCERLLEHCRIDLNNGLFVDQLWMNYAPIYFQKTRVLHHPGTNTAYWNLHEREILDDCKVSHAGAVQDLVLYHFSGFSPLHPGRLTRSDLRIGLAALPALGKLAAAYAESLLANGYMEARGIECVYVARHRAHRARLDAEFAKRHPWKTLMRKCRAAVPERIRRIVRA